MFQRVFNAVFLTYENAVELYEEAEILYNNGKTRRAYTLYHFSFEEAGRFFLLLQALFKALTREVPLSKLNYKYLVSLGYEEHTKKLDESIFKLFLLPIHNAMENGDIKIQEMIEGYEKLAARTEDFNELKNRSIYICHVENEFVSPAISINQENVDTIKGLAEVQLRHMTAVIEVLNEMGSLENLKKAFEENVTIKMNG